MQVRERHLGHDVTADTEKHSAHDAERHNDETDSKEWIEPRDDLVNRQERRHRIVEEDNAEPRKHFLPRELGEQHRRTRHKDDTDENEQDNGEDTHDLQHDVPQILADDLGETLTVLTERDHA